MGSLFGKPHKSRITEQDKAVLQLKQQRDKLEQFQVKINFQIEKDRQVAKQLLNNGKREKAKSLLRKKKFQETLLSKTDAQLENIQQMVQDIEFSQIELKVIEGLKCGNEALNKMHKLMSLENVERIMDETSDAVQYQRELDEVLSGGLSIQDENDVTAELDAIIASETQSATINLPDVPTDKLQSAIKTKPTKKKIAVET